MGTSAGDILLQRLLATSGDNDWLVVALEGSKSKSFKFHGRHGIYFTHHYDQIQSQSNTSF